jgi:peptidoglycan lytic transglycosylase
LIDADVIRFFFKLILCALVAIVAGFVLLAVRSGDPAYTFYEWISPARFRQYDALIRSVAAEQHLDPMLVKAVVWRESRFDPRKRGNAGERGLMQVSEKAASEWAQENRIDNFQPDQLYDPRTNLEAGAWYLQRALDHWQDQAEPLSFALAEYNAGASRAQRWADGKDPAASGDEFRRKIEFPGTRSYVNSIIARYKFYKRRGRM